MYKMKSLSRKLQLNELVHTKKIKQTHAFEFINIIYNIHINIQQIRNV